MTSRADDRRPAPEGSSGPRGRFDPLRFRHPNPEDREPRPEVSPEDVAATRVALAELKRRTRRGSAQRATGQATPKAPRKCDTYEQVAQYLLNEFAETFGLERVEPKQRQKGRVTRWSIDAKGVLLNNEGILVVECRRYPGSKQNQGQAAHLAYSIKDLGAKGGIFVSPIGLQSGARAIAAAENIKDVRLDENSTTTDYVLRFLGRIFAGLSDTAAATDSVSIQVIRDGKEI